MTETQPENNAPATARKRRPAAGAAGHGAAVTTAEDIVSALESVTTRLTAVEESVSAGIVGRLDHHDTILHGIAQGLTRVTDLLDRHAPLVERAATLMDPGSKLRGLTGRGRRG